MQYTHNVSFFVILISMLTTPKIIISLFDVQTLTKTCLFYPNNRNEVKKRKEQSHTSINQTNKQYD